MLVLLWSIHMATEAAAVTVAKIAVLLTSHGEHMINAETAALVRLQEEVAIPIESSTRLWNNINLG